MTFQLQADKDLPAPRKPSARFPPCTSISMKTPQHRAIRTDGDMPVPNFVPAACPEKNQVVWRVDGL